MPPRHFLPSLPPPGPAEVDGDLGHHLGRVLRVRPGEVVRLGDGLGGLASAVVVAVQRDRVTLQVGESRHVPQPACRVHVAFAPPRLQRAEWLFEHGTEVGIGVFHPLWTERTRPQGERAERWARIARAAASQSDRDWLPAIRRAREFAEFLADPALPAARFVASAGAPPLLEEAPRHGDLLLLVGPEGGFTAEEAGTAAAAGFVSAGLGPHTLRTETAAVVGAGLLLGR